MLHVLVQFTLQEEVWVRDDDKEYNKKESRS
jgi:hypothetical protein